MRLILCVVLAFLWIGISQQIPPFDNPLEVQNGYAVLSIPLQVQSKFGLLEQLINAIKAVFAIETGTPRDSWRYRDWQVDDSAEDLFILRFLVLVPVEDVSRVEKDVTQFGGSGGLTRRFQSMGITGLRFSVGQPELSPSPTPKQRAVRQPDTAQQIDNFLDDVPLPGMNEEVSPLVPLYIRSPTLFFHPTLKEAILWFAGSRTDTLTAPRSWYLFDVDVLDEDLGQYIAKVLYIGRNETTKNATSRLRELVSDGSLNAFIEEHDATNITISLLPRLNNMRPERNTTQNMEGSSVSVLLWIQAPISGVSIEMHESMIALSSDATKTKPETWKLSQLEEETRGALNGPFLVTYYLKGEGHRRREVVSLMTGYVRSRELNADLRKLGYVDVRIQSRKRLTKFKKGNRGGDIRSSGTTAIASVIGMMIVVVTGAFVLCLLPRDYNFVSIRSRREDAWWNSSRL